MACCAGGQPDNGRQLWRVDGQSYSCEGWGEGAIVGTAFRHAFSHALRMRDSDGGVIYNSIIIPSPAVARYLHLLLGGYPEYLVFIFSRY